MARQQGTHLSEIKCVAGEHYTRYEVDSPIGDEAVCPRRRKKRIKNHYKHTVMKKEGIKESRR